MDSSSDRIALEFMVLGRPTNPSTVSEGEVCGSLEVMTPQAGHSFKEWALSGYDLSGKAGGKTAPADQEVSSEAMRPQAPRQLVK
jgi:hypothetical protein